MSVQAGVWNYDGKPVDRDFIDKISRELAEYGPDGETTFFDDSVGILYRSFHTTPESRLERQPHVSDSGKVFTWDGRLDNRDELIPQLHSNLTADHTDLALVEAAFECWGTNSFAMLIGDWALAIWDPRDKELILARDYAGIRHLFYYPKSKSVIWCSHLESLALCGDQFTLCDEYFAGYLALWPEAHLTPYREIHSVPPGKFGSVRNGTVSIHSYWTFNPQLKTRHKSDAEYEEHFRYLFRQAVRRRLRTDSPILADLSGGLDSSSIVCMADEILARDGAQTPLVDTFSSYDRGEPDEEDFLYFTKVEEKRGRKGHHAELRGLGDSFLLEYPRFFANPGIGARLETNALKSEIIKRGGYRVLLSGTGGDEMLGQALDPRIQIADLLRELRFKKMADQLVVWSLLLRRPWIHLFLNAFLLQLPVSIRMRITRTAKVEPWVNEKFARKYRLSARQLQAAEGSWTWLPSARDSFQGLLVLTRQMTQTVPCTEEIRYPYLDQNLVQFLTSIPTEQLLRPNDRRSLMRRTLVGLLPQEILSRRTKASGGRFLTATLEKHWDQLEGLLRSPIILQLGYVNQAQFHASAADAKNGNLSRHFLQLFRALSWELWVRDAITRDVIAIQPSVSASFGAGLVQLRA